MEQIIDLISGYFTALDWTYICTLIIISHFITNDKNVDMFRWKIKAILLAVPMIWRVFFIGFFYGMFIYWIRDYQGKTGIEVLVHSWLFAVVTHKMLLAKLAKKIK